MRRPLHERNLLVEPSLLPPEVARDLGAGAVTWKYADPPPDPASLDERHDDDVDAGGGELGDAELRDVDLAGSRPRSGRRGCRRLQPGSKRTQRWASITSPASSVATAVRRNSNAVLEVVVSVTVRPSTV